MRRLREVVKSGEEATEGIEQVERKEMAEFIFSMCVILSRTLASSSAAEDFGRTGDEGISDIFVSKEVSCLWASRSKSIEFRRCFDWSNSCLCNKRLFLNCFILNKLVCVYACVCV